MGLETADAELTEMAMGVEQQNPMGMGMNPMGMNPVMNPGYQQGDEKLFVKFYKHPKEDKESSKREGRPIFKDADYIEIMQPGNKESVIRRPVTKKDVQRFLVQYQRYKMQEDQKVDGTPVEQAPFLTKSQVEELKYFNVFTVEQLAGMSDANTQNARGMQTLKQKAQAWLDSAAGTAKDTALAEEVHELRNSLKAMEENNAALQARIDELESKPEAESEESETKGGFFSKKK